MVTVLETTAGQLAVNEALPPDLRDYNRVLDGSGVTKLFQQLGESYRDDPDVYRNVAKSLSDIGRETAYRTGGFSFGLQHLRQSPATKQRLQEIEQQTQQILKGAGDSQEKQQKILQLLTDARDPIEKMVYDDAVHTNNPLSTQVLSRIRGNKTNLRSLLGADLLYIDQKNQPIPVPVLKSYSQGLSPAEYWAGAYGARKGVTDVKLGTAKAGYFGKLLTQAAHRLIVTGDDDPEDDGTAIRGLPTDTNDGGNVGALLAIPMGGYKRNTIITPRILKDLQNQNIDRILVRSPAVGGPSDGGVYARDVGVREKNGLPPRADFVGVAAAQALAEKIAQGALSSKHSGGVAGSSANAAVSGFDHLNQLVSIPQTFKGGATHAEADGAISSIEEAPQGGSFVTVSGVKHYVPHGYQLSHKIGDEVEAGDTLSDGIPNPAKIVQYKGIGEGRRYFVKAFKDAMDGAGVNSERRNIELVARGLIDHVRLTAELGDFSPDDVVPYRAIENNWEPREDSALTSLSSSVGHYLEKPVLHYSIGTRIKKSMIPDLQRFGVGQLLTNREPPPFVPEMITAKANMSHDTDWMTRFLGSGHKDSLLKSVHRGLESDPDGTSYVPAIASGVDFGLMGKTAPVPSLPSSSLLSSSKLN